MSDVIMSKQELLSVDQQVGRNIRKLRKDRGESQETLAAALGLTFQQVQKYERGANRVSASKLVAIAKHYQVPVALFFEGIDGLAENTDEHRALVARQRDESLESAAAEVENASAKVAARIRGLKS